MDLSPNQVRAYAQQYAGLLLLNADARNAVSATGKHESPDFHQKLAVILNEHLRPERPLDQSDAEAICKYASDHLHDFREHLKSIAPDKAEAIAGPYVDGFHAQPR